MLLFTTATGQVVRLEVSILRVVGSYPTQWTSTYVPVGGGWLNKPLQAPGLVDTNYRWKNGPKRAIKSSVLTSIDWDTSAKTGYLQKYFLHDKKP
jgi:hypothetical protein